MAPESVTGDEFSLGPAQLIASGFFEGQQVRGGVEGHVVLMAGSVKPSNRMAECEKYPEQVSSPAP